MTDAGMQKCEIITGYQLSYEEQRVERHTPLECMELKEEGLYTCFVKNPYAMQRRLTHGIAATEEIPGRIRKDAFMCPSVISFSSAAYKD